ncbi:hypothetical protein SKAU_G00417850 [Synaphobranchus kaupii]|uniref:Uncharacterized protein n=1 Tax=Synaphobranchus kaupii TaxID=118154 RepID=A0A9Q1E621_SYNKA|nr:hypothetical protein SKAU_G00417850 [Synaphobranchus kaupii]
MALFKPVLLDLSEEPCSCACPAACGALIPARDTHSLCVMRLGSKHAQEAIDSPESCSHCLALPKKLRRWRQGVAATHGNDLGPEDSDKEDDSTTASLPLQDLPSLSWADRSDPDMLAFPLSLSGTPILEEETSDNNDMAVASDYSGEEDSIPPAHLAPGMGTAHGQPHALLLEVSSCAISIAVSVTHECTAALRHWENTDFFTQGTPLGAVLMRKVVTTDASLSGRARRGAIGCFCGGHDWMSFTIGGSLHSLFQRTEVTTVT